MNERQTAIHEAGHAVAHYRLGLETLMVSTLPDEEKSTAGRVTGRGRESIFSAADAEVQMLAYLAGYATCVANGYPEDEAERGCQDDYAHATQILNDWQIGDFNSWKIRAVELMEEPRNKAAVLRIADELMERRRISGDHAAVLIEVADGESTQEELKRYLLLSGRG